LIGMGSPQGIETKISSARLEHRGSTGWKALTIEKSAFVSTNAKRGSSPI
jgi:hypothetical protein